MRVDANIEVCVDIYKKYFFSLLRHLDTRLLLTTCASVK